MLILFSNSTDQKRYYSEQINGKRQTIAIKDPSLQILFMHS